jgi:spore coat protein A, manganese oxidase
MIDRRQFLKASAATGILAGAGVLFRPRRAWPFLQTPKGISKFTTPLQGLGPTGIPVATPNTTRFPGSDYYKIVAGEFRQVFHPDFYKIYGNDFPGTKLWGYASENPADLVSGKRNHRYLGGLIIANKGRPVRLQVRNGLMDRIGNPLQHPVPVDPTAMDDLVITPEQKALENRIGVHIHGGKVPWISDGGPFSWFGTPNPKTGIAPTGPSKFDVPDMPKPPQGAMTFYYPNDQSARLLWYHDHAYGLTRINAYAGLATGYLLLDQFEANLIKLGIIPDIAHLVPLVLQDKSFIPPDTANDPGGRGNPGDLWYPSVYDPDRWELTGTPPVPSCVPEFFGDTTVINGVCYPFLPVEQRHYRFTFLNGSQARVFNLQLYYDDGTGEADLKKFGPKMIQIGTEGGFLPFPVELNNPPVPFTAQFDTQGNVIPSSMTYNLLLGGAERADVIIDFSNCPVGSKLILYNDAPGPFPNGDPLYDYYTASPDQPASGGPGVGPNTRTLMQFIVGPLTGKADPPQMNLLEKIALKGLHGGLAGGTLAQNSILPAIVNLTPSGKHPRRLALYEDFDKNGRLRQLLGTLAGPTEYTSSEGEVVREDDVEVWEIYNTTGDTHPIHFHLVDVRVLGRAPFVPDATDPLGLGRPMLDSNGNPVLAGPFREPDNNERGFKETVRMNPGEVTRVIMKFDLPNPPFTVPVSPRLAQPPYSIKAHEYVWHCHILEHEEHDMMHALSVLPKT